jgi:nitric oxide reductase NorE protein
MSAPTALASPHRSNAHLPGEAGIWVFVLGDMFVFALMFALFVYYRNENIEMYVNSQKALSQNCGALNTLLLLTSSWLVARGVHLAREGKTKPAWRLLSAARLCGVGFALVKFFEYGEKIHEGITPKSNEFFMFYYVLTGIHFMHVTIGLGVLTFMILRLRDPEPPSAMMLECGATYWHMVDLLWIVLFPLLYLMK